MSANRHILVIGGGPAGVQAALAAASQGRSVTLVSDGPLGGRAAWQTLLPSKIWLERRAGQPLDLAGMRARYEQVAGAWQRQQQLDLERAGVDVLLGTASFLSPHEIQVAPPEGGYPDQVSADLVIIASGAVPFVPPGLQPDGERIFAPHNIWQIQSLPEHLIVIGAGGPATEYVDAFSRLGVQITWITGPVGVLSAFPPEAGHAISQVMEKRGVRIITGMLARQIERTDRGVRVLNPSGSGYEAEAAFVAIGLRPDLERLNLPAAGLRSGSSGGMAVDPWGRTAVPHIYLVGDAASPLSANISIAQGRVAGWHAAGLEVEPLQMEMGVMAIYTNPQVAIVGRLSDRSHALQKVRVPFHTCLRAHLLDDGCPVDEACFLEVSYLAEQPRTITGALAVCPEAAEILTPLAVAVRAGMTIEALASVYTAHPTYSELAILAARMAR
jgi:pyruvate/2-oxoglutarate dehydrogenase complex dihydrolipoamide dehydrogenase (E3) component